MPKQRTAEPNPDSDLQHYRMPEDGLNYAVNFSGGQSSAFRLAHV